MEKAPPFGPVVQDALGLVLVAGIASMFAYIIYAFWELQQEERRRQKFLANRESREIDNQNRQDKAIADAARKVARLQFHLDQIPTDDRESGYRKELQSAIAEAQNVLRQMIDAERGGRGGPT